MCRLGWTVCGLVVIIYDRGQNNSPLLKDRRKGGGRDQGTLKWEGVFEMASKGSAVTMALLSLVTVGTGLLQC